MRQVDAGRVARRRVGIEDEALALYQLRRAALERPDPQLRPLQIDEDRRRAAGVLFERADRGDRLRMPVMVAMAHIDAKGVGAGAVERRDHGVTVVAGTQGWKNAHLAPAGGDNLNP